MIVVFLFLNVTIVILNNIDGCFDSVAEHQAASPQAYEQYLGILTKLAPLGFGMVAIAYSNDASSFLLVYGMATYFFSHKMVRLILLTAPIACVFGGVVVGRIAGWCVEGVIGMRLDAADMPSLLLGREVEANVVPMTDGAEKDSKKKKKYTDKSKGTVQNNEKQSITSNPLYQLIVKCAWMYLAYYLYHRAQPHKTQFQDKCRELSYGLSHPSILFQSNTASGAVVTVDDYREAYWWLRDNTPEDSRIMAWWDYGYQITAIANRTTLAVST
jgi:dolichyl-diphosphooligosaccharide--protein glycosyltransferase